jgi:hypothetical protein
MRGDSRRNPLGPGAESSILQTHSMPRGGEGAAKRPIDMLRQSGQMRVQYAFIRSEVDWALSR